MSGYLEQPVHRDLQELAHDMGLWLTNVSGGSKPAGQQLAAEYLIELFGAQGNGSTVTDQLLSGLLEYKGKQTA